MTFSSKFAALEAQVEDPIIRIMNLYNNDITPNKIDCSIGVYKDGEGEFYTFPCIEQAKQAYLLKGYDFNYHSMAGLPEFTKNAQTILFDEPKSNIVTIQTVGGTNSLHTGFAFAKTLGIENFYLGVPSWTNYQGMIDHIGANFYSYDYLKNEEASLENALEAIASAKPNSAFILQACCHNPTATDYSKESWIKIIDALSKKKILPIIDIAYQGFASGDFKKDAWIVQYIYSLNLEYVVCQSFSKNLGLYSERLGALHVITQDESYMGAVKGNLLSVFRHESSFAPTYGGRLCNIVNSDFKTEWIRDIEDCHKRLANIRQQVYIRLKSLNPPGHWKNVINQHGLFWWTQLTEPQINELIEKYHIYCTLNGRFNIAGLNEGNLDYFIESLDKVLRI